jgi:hypothetical protein
MSYSMRTTLVVGVCAVAVATAGCGGVASVATTSPTSSAAPPSTSTSASPQACANPEITSGTSPVTQLALTVSDLPPSGPALEQISDGEMNNTVNTDQRGFANVANTFRIEDDVVLDASTQSASADYPQLQDTTRALFTTLKDTSSPSTVGCQADEFVGTTSTGYSQVGVVFQDGDVISVILVVNSAATVDPAYAAAVALAQDQKIVAAPS